MLEVRALSKRYSGTLAVDQVSFTALPGEVTGYLGPNGSGKSTTVKMITGLLDPTSGEILYRGRPIGENMVAYKRILGYVPEEPYLYPHLTGAEYLELAGELRDLPAATLSGKIGALLELFSLSGDRNAPISSYSKGMRQKILICAAILHDPDLIILDEPFSGLDVHAALVLRSLIRSLAASGKIVLFSSHVLEVVEKVCHRVVILHKGRAVANDTIDHLRDLMALPTLEDIFAQTGYRHRPGCHGAADRRSGPPVSLPGAREGRQFRVLVRLFGYRFFDTDIISVRGDLSSLLSQFAALLAALSLILVILTGPKYAGLYEHLTRNQLRYAAWADQEFLISTSMAIAGVLTLLLWDALFPDQRDCLILGAMPVRIRTLFSAKVAALAAALGLAVLAVNSFTGLVCPFLIVPDATSPLAAARAFAVFWIVIPLASFFVFLLLLGVQGAALHLLPHHLYLRWSSLIQTAAFFAVLTLYFLTPPLAHPRALADPANRLWYALVPSYWFFGLFEVLSGSVDPAMQALARRALAGVGLAALLASVAYAMAYARQMRRTVEQSGIAVSRRHLAPWKAIARFCARRAPERAILTFIGRTLARSRQHRLLLAIYAGMGLAYVFSQLAYILYRARAERYGALESREQTILGIPLILLFFLIIGLRVAFSIPTEVRANWLFRLTDPYARGAYLKATRKTLLLFALAPVVAIAGPVYMAIWPWPRAWGHTAFVAMFGLLLIELALGGFAKVPFTCSYLPGKANLKIMFGVYWGLVFLISEILTDIEYRALARPSSYAWLMGIMWLAWLIAAHRGRLARARTDGLSFEERPEPAVVSLGLAGQIQ